MNKLSKAFLAIALSFSIVGTATLAFGKKEEVSTLAYDASYYSSIGDKTGAALLTALNSLNISKKKRSVGYDGFRSFAAKCDKDPSGSKIVGFYDNKLVGPSWDSASTWNREHVWPKSRKGGNVENDAHMVRAAATSTNGDRGNAFFAASGAYDPGQFVAEYRGIAARIIFYCAIADTSLKLVDKTTDSSANGTMGKLSDLLKWNLEYLPSTSSTASLALRVEQNRNNVIEKDSQGQGNRNPFIDHPEYACKIWGDTNETTKSICKNNTGGGGGTGGDGGDGGNTDKPVKVSHAGTQADPYSVTNAIEVASKLSATDKTDKMYVVGVAASDAVKGSKSDDVRFDLQDDENSITVYYADPNGLTVKAGDYVTVSGNLINYNGSTPEVADEGSVVESIANAYPANWKLNDDTQGGGGGTGGGDGGNTDAEIVSIAVSGQKVDFHAGDKFEFGGTVTATLKDGKTKDVTAECSFSNYNMNKEGDYTVIVICGDAYTEYNITVGAPLNPGKGCKGSVVGASIVVFLSAIGGFGLLLRKRKED